LSHHLTTIEIFYSGCQHQLTEKNSTQIPAGIKYHQLELTAELIGGYFFVGAIAYLSDAISDVLKR
jgi:hypothetical protein